LENPFFSPGTFGDPAKSGTGQSDDPSCRVPIWLQTGTPFNDNSKKIPNLFQPDKHSFRSESDFVDRKTALGRTSLNIRAIFRSVKG
jgi:hypothetical protein